MAGPVGTDVQTHVWYDEQQNVIKIRIAGELTSVNNNAASKRGNPSLYKKLAGVIRDDGKKFSSGVL